MSQEATAPTVAERGVAQRLRDKVQSVINPPVEHEHVMLSTKYKPHPTEKMLAAEWHGKESVRVAERAKPMITAPQDAIVRVTASTVCGSDLHMYFDALPFPGALQPGDILGHESVGYVEEVGPDVKDIKVGDRVVISAVISCGQCEYCKRGEFSCCDVTNPSSAMESTYGHRISALFGYSHVCGGVAGCQAEYVRVPYSDVNLLKVSSNLEDKKILALADIMCTGWHANEKASVGSGDQVVVWGCGPVGLMAAYLAKFRGASRVISIDNIPHRLNAAAALGAETINFDEVDVIQRVRELMPGGPDCALDCVGFRFPKSYTHWFMQKLKLETDAIDVLEEAIYLTRKNGRIACIGDYFAFANKFPIGAFMEKGLSMSGGQLFCQKYWAYLLEQMEAGKLDPSFVFTHDYTFDKIPEAYDTFGHYRDNILKSFIVTSYGEQMEANRRSRAEKVAGSGTQQIIGRLAPAGENASRR